MDPILIQLNSDHVFTAQFSKKRRIHLGCIGVDWRIILRHLKGIGCGGTDWSELAQDRVQWRILIKSGESSSSLNRRVIS
jgi:hypothetical protein